MNEIPPAVTLYWQEEEIKRLTASLRSLQIDYRAHVGALADVRAERDQLRTLLAACQKALKDMQAQRDKAREGKR